MLSGLQSADMTLRQSALASQFLLRHFQFFAPLLNRLTNLAVIRRNGVLCFFADAQREINWTATWGNIPRCLSEDFSDCPRDFTALIRAFSRIEQFDQFQDALPLPWRKFLENQKCLLHLP